MTGGVSAGNMGGGLHFTLQPEISEIDLERGGLRIEGVEK